MMPHEEALTLLLAGGPVPLGAAGHLDGCPACRAEFEALKALEGDLRRACPAAPAGKVPSRLTHGATSPARRWSQAAAAAALLLGLLGGFAAGRIATPSAPAPLATLQTVTYTVADDTTFALLSATGSLASEEPSDEELADYFESHWGG